MRASSHSSSSSKAATCQTTLRDNPLGRLALLPRQSVREGFAEWYHRVLGDGATTAELGSQAVRENPLWAARCLSSVGYNPRGRCSILFKRRNPVEY
jgi:hypothetical protein